MMTLNEYVNLTELLKEFRREVDNDFAAKIEKAGFNGPYTEIYLKGKENLELVDTFIEMVGTYQLNAPVDVDTDEADESKTENELADWGHPSRATYC